MWSWWWREGEASGGRAGAMYWLCTAAIRQVQGSIDLVCWGRGAWLLVVFVTL